MPWTAITTGLRHRRPIPRGYDVLTAGLLSALSPATGAVCAPFAGRLASRHGFRPFVVAGPFIVGGFALLYTQTFTAERQPALFVVLGILLAIGVGAFIPVNTAAAMAELPPARLSSGGAVNNTLRQVGSVLGISALVAVGLRQLGANQLDSGPQRT